MFQSIKKVFFVYNLFRRAFYKYKSKITLMTLLGLISGFLGGIGISAIIPLFSFIGGASNQDTDQITRITQRAFNLLHIEYKLSFLILFIALLFIFKAIFLHLANYINYKSAIDYEKQTRQELFQHVLRSNWPHLLTQKIGHLSTVILDDVNSGSSLLIGISVTILFAASLITYTIVAFTISAPITLVTFAIGIILFLILMPFFKKIRQLSKEGTAINKIVAHHVNQHLQGAKTVKAMAVEGGVLKKSDIFFNRLRNIRFQIYKHKSIMGTFLEPLTLVIIIPIFVLSYRNPNFNIASFVAILYLVQKMFSFMQSIQIRLNLINEDAPRLMEVLKNLEEARFYEEKSQGEAVFSFRSAIEFNDVIFDYNEGIVVLSGVSLSIRKGETVGLIGPSGSGKTTLVDLILRLFEPTSGRITIDGKGISKFGLADWRTHIGYVSQDIFLLNDTIENNIKFYNQAVDQKDIADAAKKSNIYEFIMRQPQQFKTMVGERGLQLSVGQRQRIVLARVLASKPEILILDEATSALDNESEAAIQEAIGNLRGKVTIFMIAHRLTTVVNADKIFVLDHGKVVETGSPEDLLKNKNSYFYQTYHIK